ncbi:MAG: alpha/beta fold hydrolase [Planctomycetaceae bacterium]|nr:alpha/beta fold hydrolase [Planctomycetaceae bacterium]
MTDTRSPAEQTSRLRMSDGAELFCRRWQPQPSPAAVSPRGRILALHGIQSHSGWYGWSSRWLAAAGYDVWFPDRRGSGHSTQPATAAISIDRLTADVIEQLGHLRAMEDQTDNQTGSAATSPADATDRAGDRKSPLPVFLLGLSWGGRLAAAVAAAAPGLMDGLILLYPGIVAHVGPSPVQVAALEQFCRFGLGGLKFRIPLDDPQLFTDDPAAQEFIRTDPLALHKAPASLLLAGVQLERRVQHSRFVLNVPTIQLLAGGDRLIDTPATRTIIERAAGPRCTTFVYPKAAHTLEFDSNREQIFGDLVGWLNRQTTGTANGS